MQQPQGYHRPHHSLSSRYLDLVADGDVDEEDVDADSAAVDATGAGVLVSSQIPLPITNRGSIMEEYPHLREGAADAEEPALTRPTNTSVGITGMLATAADLMCPDGTLAQHARGRARPATMMDTTAKLARSSSTQDMRPRYVPRTRSTCLSRGRKRANDY